MGTTALRDRCQCLAGAISACFDGNVTERQDADQLLAAVENGNASDLLVAEIAADVVEISSPKQYLTLGDMTSLTLVPGPRPSATARMAIFRSVCMPTGLPSWPTGTTPASISAHDTGGVLNRLVRIGDAHIARHDVADFHRSNSFSLKAPETA
jgi:hypothetical protein